MGRGRRRRRQRRPAASTSGRQLTDLSLLAPTESIPEIAAALGNFGFVMVLFETPSGFAIFEIDDALLYHPDAMENLWACFGDIFRSKDATWLKGFEIFENKSSAINPHTGVDKQLAKFIRKCRTREECMAVGKPQYQEVIEKYLGIPCIYNEVVMELMWGLKNLLHIFVPGEELKLTEEDRKQESHGLSKLLSRYGFSQVKPEMVNALIVEKAVVLFDCDSVEKKYSELIKDDLGGSLEELLGINTGDWTVPKIATAVKIIYDKTVPNDAQEMFSADELMKLDNYHEYDEDKFPKNYCLNFYEHMACVQQTRVETCQELSVLIEKAGGHEAAKKTQENE